MAKSSFTLACDVQHLDGPDDAWALHVSLGYSGLDRAQLLWLEGQLRGLVDSLYLKALEMQEP